MDGKRLHVSSNNATNQTRPVFAASFNQMIKSQINLKFGSDYDF
jgi:hypothetical protein